MVDSMVASMASHLVAMSAALWVAWLAPPLAANSAEKRDAARAAKRAES